MVVKPCLLPILETRQKQGLCSHIDRSRLWLPQACTGYVTTLIFLLRRSQEGSGGVAMLISTCYGHCDKSRTI